MNPQEQSLVGNVKHAEGKYGGFSFGGQEPEGVTVCNPLPAGTVFPNGARAAILLTFDVEGNYGNGVGDVEREVANYQRICNRLSENQISATFNVVGRMAEDYGPEFVEWMVDSGCEVASHGYVHDMNKRYGGNRVYAGHYGPRENLEQIRDGIEALNKIRPDVVRGARLPYGHFNEYTYEAMEQYGLAWSSLVGIDDFNNPGQGFGNDPFQMKLGDRIYPIVEIPMDSQTFDWPIWIADEKANRTFVQAVRNYCELRNIPFERTPRGAVRIWRQRVLDTIERQTVFTLCCHPINLTVKGRDWSDPVTEFIFPIIDLLGCFQREGKAWICTCNQLAQLYRQVTKE